MSKLDKPKLKPLVIEDIEEDIEVPTFSLKSKGTDKVREDAEDNNEEVRAEDTANENVGHTSAPLLIEEEFVDQDYMLEDDDQDLVEGVEHARVGRPRIPEVVRSSGVDPTMNI